MPGPGPRRLGAAAVAVLLAACTAQVHVPPPSTDIDEVGFRDVLRNLTADEYEGRRPGTTGEDKTIAFLTAQFRRLGLRPGNGDSYVQPVPLLEITAAADASLTITGRGRTTVFDYAKNMVIWTKRPAAEGSLRHSEIVFAGYGIVAPEYAWNDYAQTDVTGKTVVVLAGDPGTGGANPQLFRGNAGTSYGRWIYKAEEAARHGAAGLLVIHDPRLAGYSWAAVVNSFTGPQFGAAPGGAQAPPRPAVEGWLDAASAPNLFAQAGLGTAAIESAGRAGFKAMRTNLVADALVHNVIRPVTSANLIAVLPGYGHKQEAVLYTAHWDHLGRRGDTTFTGAVDDASGVAGLVVLAQSFVRTHPAADRSIGFIAFTAEEGDGLLGSRYYIEHPLFSLQRTVAALNLDVLHIGGPARDVMVIGSGNSELEDYLREQALLQGRETRPDAAPEAGDYYRTAAFAFAAAGVPALYARAGLDDSARGPVAGRQRFDDYRSRRFRQSGDVYHADWDVRGTLDDLRLYYAVGNRLARTRRYPRFYPTSEFSSSATTGAAP